MIIARIRRPAAFVSRGITPDSVGSEFNQDLFDLRLSESVKTGRFGPQ